MGSRAKWEDMTSFERSKSNIAQNVKEAPTKIQKESAEYSESTQKARDGGRLLSVTPLKNTIELLLKNVTKNLED